MDKPVFERRRFIRSTAFGLIGITAFGYANGRDRFSGRIGSGPDEPVFYRYPSMNDEMVSTIVGAAHNNFDKVKDLVARRPELAGAAWDWGFGDWETALGAASHVGRKDIALLLISHGARPDIFTFTMLGMLQSVREIVETVPGIQTHRGPHGITLLQHARNRLSADKDISASDRNRVNEVIAYLEDLGNADMKPVSLDIPENEKKRISGEYRFGSGEGELFVVNVNARNLLQIARKGFTPRWLNKIAEDTFSPSGAPSVKIVFSIRDGKALSLSVHEPEPIITAARI